MSWGRSNRLSTGVEDALRLNAAAVAHGQGVQDALDLYQRLAGAPVPASR
jgi:hypothetical protein